MGDLLRFTDEGIYCEEGDFHIDPWKPVKRAIITHAHSDHARRDMGAYLCHTDSVNLLKHRLGLDIAVQGIPYGQRISLGKTEVTLYPAGHVAGSAQVKVSGRSGIWVVSGDYKLAPDPLCQAFEPVPCDVFITESTFGLPAYRWKSPQEIANAIHSWWVECLAERRTPIIFAYSLGKAQRLISMLQEGPAPVLVHGAIAGVNRALEASGMSVGNYQPVSSAGPNIVEKSIVIAPPSALSSPWMKRFKNPSTALASGWMALRGARRRRNADMGFALSDHADWPGLNHAVASTGAGRVLVTHGYSSIFSAWLREQGLDAAEVKTYFDGELGEISESAIAPESIDLEDNEAV
jgi:putative mRNA 3-end processing factor